MLSEYELRLVLFDAARVKHSSAFCPGELVALFSRPDILQRGSEWAGVYLSFAPTQRWVTRRVQVDTEGLTLPVVYVWSQSTLNTVKHFVSVV